MTEHSFIRLTGMRAGSATSAEQLAQIVRWTYLRDLLDATDWRIGLALGEQDQAAYVSQLLERAWTCWQLREWWSADPKAGRAGWPGVSTTWDDFMRQDLERAGRLLPLVLEARRAA